MATTRPGPGTTPEWRLLSRLFASASLVAFCVGLSAQSPQPRQSPRRSAPLLPAIPLITDPNASEDAANKPVADETAVAIAAAIAHGQFDEVTRLAATLPDDDPRALYGRGAIARAKGQYDEAQKLWRRAATAAPAGDAALSLGRLLMMLGRRQEASAVLAPVIEQGTAAGDAASTGRAARAAHTLGQFRIANGLYREAAGARPTDAQVNTWWGELLLEKYNRPEAIKSFQAALAGDSTHAEAHLGLARALASENPPAAAASARRALEFNPSQTGALVVLAELALDAGRRDEAREELQRALAINASDLPALALSASIPLLEGRTDEFERGVERTLAVQPRYSDVFRIAAEQVAHQYRFDDAAALVKRGLALEPEASRANADHGMYLLRTGDEAGARKALDRAFAADPFDVQTFNLLGLLDTLDGFETITSGDLVVRLSSDEAAIMREYVIPLAERTMKELSGRYGFTPKGPILIEMFPRHDDFAVRTAGLPGMIGAVGACFGRVVTLDSPRARPPDSFNWQATLRHELAHVYTLQMSSQRIARWLTEGVSVYEERRASPGWGRESEVEFVQALARDEVLPIAKIGEGFSDPRRIAITYYQASLLVEHIVESHGEEGLHRLVRAYVGGATNEAALTSALQTDVATLQSSFDAFVAKRFGATRDAFATPDAVVEAVESNDLSAIRRAAEHNPGSYAAQLALGRALVSAGDQQEAASALERANGLGPDTTGPDSPRALLARLAEQEGDKQKAMTLLTSLLEDDHTGSEIARALLRLASEAGDTDKERFALERLVTVNPFDATPHQGLGRLALAADDAQFAVRSFKLALIAGAPDLAAAHTDLAQGYLMAGHTADAKHEVIAALEIAPRFERAQELLLDIVDGAAVKTRKEERP